MVNEDTLMTRLNKLKENIAFLDNIKKYTEVEYVKNPFIYGSSERFFHLAIECDMRYRKPETNRDVFEILYENEIITLELKENLSDMASFRNILVHDYVKIDRGVVYKIITEDIEDLMLYMKEIVRYFYG
ncbi:DUF86 domain-containing protein [Serpentinicella alkaliphila]|uniref:Uncharacterized protein YutE (UPF0331/DUF86 family) n=1 Tax=Serpentinicella alkaliphila TaxID=1734049 RepID=A0A4R2UCW6_9FIRM|nr:DUF86 domain-containing protein [Serpentinicella alkaliphila]QUH26886.1 DUF86 domain-containing protein [Serpentinicella alkaliphila]TCQ08119.1 uncharacterized protein YutE (UPF0331/DUF86 family) [Serpentinicella alkaliphila]